ncbi:MAG: type VI secretion system contractile sheath large subunit, partial [Acidobacteria bacterium]|nr:type VI secretion system contractile sheath large subunit [Acidobacteriota bacterium]
MAEETKPAADGGGETKELTLLERVVLEGKMARDETQQPHARDLVAEFVNQILDQQMVISADTVAGIEARIAQIDELLSNQLNQILHHEEFQQLEASWRGLHYLVMNTETGTQLKLRLLNITKKELLTDLEKATEFDQSSLFKKVYEEEYGTFGGNPYSSLVADYYFGRHPQDMALLE